MPGVHVSVPRRRREHGSAKVPPQAARSALDAEHGGHHATAPRQGRTRNCTPHLAGALRANWPPRAGVKGTGINAGGGLLRCLKHCPEDRGRYNSFRSLSDCCLIAQADRAKHGLIQRSGSFGPTSATTIIASAALRLAKKTGKGRDPAGIDPATNKGPLRLCPDGKNRLVSTHLGDRNCSAIGYSDVKDRLGNC